MPLISWLKSQIDLAGLSQAEFGRRVGWSELLVSRVLNRHRTLTADDFAAACRLFRWPIPTDGTRLSDLVLLAQRLDPDDLDHVIRLAERLDRHPGSGSQ